MRPAQLRRAVFLDRDGTLNATCFDEAARPVPPVRLDQFSLLPGVTEACARLHGAGFVLVVATNQPDVGRGTQTIGQVEAMHSLLQKLIPEITHIEVSYDPYDHADARRRKPCPGMVFDAAKTLALDLGRSWMVGDRWRDIECGRRAGLRTLLIGDGYGEAFPSSPDHTVATFPEAADLILSTTLPLNPAIS